jgi:putative endonuclease
VPSPSQTFGYAQEEVAEDHLIRAGYRVVERNWRGAGAEVDRIAWDDGVLCFVEVRARSRRDFGRPEETVGRTKQRHLIRAALAYLTTFPPSRPPMVRFDVVSVQPTPDGEWAVRLFKNAFDAGR